MPRRLHKCEARECRRLVPTAEIMCRPHWGMVPAPLRDLLVRLHRKGLPSREYVAALVTARDAIDNT